MLIAVFSHLMGRAYDTVLLVHYSSDDHDVVPDKHVADVEHGDSDDDS